MSLEQKIEALTAAVEANTAALQANGGTTTSKPATKDAGPKETAAQKKKREAEEAAAAAAAEDDGLGGDDGLGDGLDDGDDLGGDEPSFTYDELTKLIMALRDIGGKGENKEDCRLVIKKAGVANFKELEGEESKYDAVAAHIKALAKAKKTTL